MTALPIYSSPPTDCTLMGEPWVCPPARPGGASTRGSHHLSLPLRCETQAAYAINRKLRLKENDVYLATGSILHVHQGYRYEAMTPSPAQWYFDLDKSVALREAAEGLTEAAQRSCLQVGESAAQAWDAWCTKHGERFPEPIAAEREEYVTLHEVLGAKCPVEYRKEIVSSRTDLLSLHKGGVLLPIDWKVTYVDGRSGLLPKWNPSNNEWVMGAQAAVNRMVLRTRYPEAELGHFTLVRVSRDSPHDFAVSSVVLPEDYEEQLPLLCLESIRKSFEIRDKLARKERLLRDGALRGVCKPGPKKRPCDYLDLCQVTGLERVAARELLYVIQGGDE